MLLPSRFAMSGLLSTCTPRVVNRHRGAAKSASNRASGGNETACNPSGSNASRIRHHSSLRLFAKPNLPDLSRAWLASAEFTPIV